MLTKIINYLAASPKNGLDLAWRIVFFLLLVLGLLRLERIRRGQLDTQRDVQQVATAVATAVDDSPAD